MELEAHGFATILGSDLYLMHAPEDKPGPMSDDERRLLYEMLR